MNKMDISIYQQRRSHIRVTNLFETQEIVLWYIIMTRRIVLSEGPIFHSVKVN